MYVRDHQRPVFHEALGVDPDWYAYQVYEKTSELSKQIFPIVLDIDHRNWQPLLVELQKANADLAAAEKMRGPGGMLTRLGARVRAGTAVVRLLMIPAIRNDVPAVTRLEPCY